MPKRKYVNYQLTEKFCFIGTCASSEQFMNFTRPLTPLTLLHETEAGIARDHITPNLNAKMEALCKLLYRKRF